MKLWALYLAALAGVSVAVKIPFIQSKRPNLQRRSGGASVTVSHPSLAAAPQLLATESSGSSLLTLRQAMSTIRSPGTPINR
jgi:saccharopepsin